MQVPLHVTFRDVPPSDVLEAKIRDEADWLGRYFDRIVACHVTVAEPHRHRQSGRLYDVSIRLTVPGEELVTGREHHLHPGHADPYVAVREAFHAARRALEDYVRRMRGDVKHHDEPPHGTVVRLAPWQGCGLIRTPDGRELYFHRNSLARGEFDDLHAGDDVVFTEGQLGREGPTATGVRLSRHGRRHRAAGASSGGGRGGA